MSRLEGEIVRVAKSKVGNSDWAYATSKDNFGKNVWKCNKFVYDVLVEAGVHPPPQVWTTRLLIFLSQRAPTAKEWADPKVDIPGWKVVSSPKPGDVAAEPHAEYSGFSTGHVAIVVESNQTVSAVEKAVVQNDWGFRKDSKAVFRRCIWEQAAEPPASSGGGPSDGGLPGGVP